MFERDTASLHAVIFHAIANIGKLTLWQYGQYLFWYNGQKYFEGVLAVHKPWCNAVLLHTAAVISSAYLPRILRIF
jgi:hypothetical protein